MSSSLLKTVVHERACVPSHRASSSGPVTVVRLSRDEGRVTFDTAGGSYSYRLTSCNVPVGIYAVGVAVSGATVRFTFAKTPTGDEGLRFEFYVEPGRLSPATLLRGQRQVAVVATPAGRGLRR